MEKRKKDKAAVYADLIAVTDRKSVRGDFLSRIKEVAGLHPKAIILREKDLSDAGYESLAEEVMRICAAAEVPCFLHGRPEIAKKLGCTNIHMPVSMAEAAAGNFERISVSCHSLEDVRIAEKCGATQIVLGTIFETQCKRGLKGKGIDFLKKICAETDLPVYAIGGITPENLTDVLAAGAAGGCMMSGFMAAPLLR
ncbi:MAG: thiamine phosphate synthase [Clostridia bacterium]|nr:thiamine phosphate synthase [Clostridia bacterium]